MNKFKLSFAVFALLIVGCNPTNHRAELPIVEQETGRKIVKVNFHKKDQIKIGSSVDAIEKICVEKSGAKGNTRSECTSRLLGRGKVIEAQSATLALVEFDKSVILTNTSEFEITK